MRNDKWTKALNSSELVLDSEEHHRVHMLFWSSAAIHEVPVSARQGRSSQEGSPAPVLLLPSGNTAGWSHLCFAPCVATYLCKDWKQGRCKMLEDYSTSASSFTQAQKWIMSCWELLSLVLMPEAFQCLENTCFLQGQYGYWRQQMSSLRQLPWVKFKIYWTWESFGILISPSWRLLSWQIHCLENCSLMIW